MAGYIDVLSNLKLIVKKPFEPMADAGAQTGRLVPSEVVKSGGQSHAGTVLSSDMEEAEMVTLRSHIEEIRAENVELLSRRAGN